MKKNIRSAFTAFIFLAFGFNAWAQDIPAGQLKFVSFPHQMNKTWKASLGFNLTTLAQDVTEEQHLRVPCGDFHLLRRLSEHSFLDSRVQFQVFQNQLSIGPHWAFPLTHRISMSIGNDLAWWFGFINVEGFRTTGHGFQNYPNVSLGYRFNKGVLLTLREEAIMNLSIKAKTGNTPVTSDY
ncbi:MAG: hypothetical protein JO301_15855, partial [Chitinophagaceae bacterium]|nr:hypothetical protein [Chitinophagaceae bacterium]